MTKEEFLDQYYDFETQIKEVAEREAVKVNAEAEGFHVVVQEFPPFGFCLMLDTAVDFLKEIGIL